MDFFAAQEQARKKTRWLVFWFVLVVIGIAALAHLFAMQMLYLLDHGNSDVLCFLVLLCLLHAPLFYYKEAMLLRKEWMKFQNGGDPQRVRELWESNSFLLGANSAVVSVDDMISEFLKTAGFLLFLLLVMIVIILSSSDFRSILTELKFSDTFLYWNDPRAFCFSVLFSGSIAIISLYRTWKISCQGGVLIAQELGGCQIRRNASGPAERRLLNVIDEMSIAAGIPAPVAFVLTEETSLNAFAAGLSTQNSVIAVTRGLLETMNRDELQGVIAHEISHIVNGDSYFNLKLLGILSGLYALTIAGRSVMFMVSIMPLAILGTVLRFIGSVGLFFGRLIQATASREREYLADATAVQFTRNPVGLVSALNKLRASGSQIRHPQAIAASHLFFGSDDKSVSDTSWASLLATHPPLKDRIRRLGGRLSTPRLRRDESLEPADLVAVEKNQPQILTANPHAVLPVVLPVQVAMESLANDIAPEGVAHAQALLASLPETLRQEAQSVAGATGIVCGLFLSITQPDIQPQQEKLLSAAVLPIAKRLCDWLSFQPEERARYRLVWLDLVLPTLREAPQAECQQLLDWVKELIRANGRISPSKFALYSLLRNALLPPSERQDKSGKLRLEQLDRDIASLLALMAYAGHEKLEDAKTAYQAALAHSPANKEMPFPDRQDFSLKTVSLAFQHLALAAPPYRKKILEACAVAAAHDGKIMPVENELLRAFAQSLDCPAPLV